MSIYLRVAKNRVNHSILGYFIAIFPVSLHTSGEIYTLLASPFHAEHNGLFVPTM